MTTNGKLIEKNEKEFKYKHDFNAFPYISGTWNKVVINLFNTLILKFLGNNKYSLCKYNEIEKN